MTIALRRAIGVCAITLAAPFAASAQESTNRVNSMTDWNVFVDANPKECWGVSKPIESINTKDGAPVSVRRGDILLFVTYRPGAAPQVSFTGGYPFASGSTVSVAVGGTTFELFSDVEWAWSGSAEDDAALIRALRGGADAVISARSGRGTQTSDKFSLRGFSAAMDDAAARCK
ncbi:invasion associated locus B family protein [Pseudogemmobacter bohemicus]|uniref:invasion associated locus B family protein n=1 Tax=Pseudogemmobacter bohemicus TaxID=2250708 RepID=UPI000DD49F12|nr:invasion associated locus B family protein [Pseudogemmobacter bohemicus]